jgi:hypothetical protein
MRIHSQYAIAMPEDGPHVIAAIAATLLALLAYFILREVCAVVWATSCWLFTEGLGTSDFKPVKDYEGEDWAMVFISCFFPWIFIYASLTG